MAFMGNYMLRTVYNESIFKKIVRVIRRWQCVWDAMLIGPPDHSYLNQQGFYKGFNGME